MSTHVTLCTLQAGGAAGSAGASSGAGSIRCTSQEQVTSRCPISVSIFSPALEGIECASVGGACGMEPGGGRLVSYSVKKMEIQVGKERQEWLSGRRAGAARWSRTGSFLE